MSSLFDSFDAPSGIWTSQTGVPWNPVWDGYPSYGGGNISMDPANLQAGRFMSTFELDESFTIEVRLNRTWVVPSNYNGSNARAWIGVYQNGVPTQFTNDSYPYGKSHRLWQGIPTNRTAILFKQYTHYTCDLNELFNWSNNQVGNRWATLQFTRVGNSINIYNSSVLWRTFTIERPDDPLFFEFVESDWSSMAHSYTRYYYFDYSGVGEVSGLMSLSVSGALASSLSPLNIINRLSKVSDYNPQLLGTFTSSVNSVTIRLWELVDGQNTPVSISVSGCSRVGNTERWIWSTSNLPVYTGYIQQFFYTMTADNNETFNGQFFLDLPENPKGMYPISIGESLL